MPTDPHSTTDKLEEARQRLAEAIGYLLAQEWLRRRPPTIHPALPATSDPQIVAEGILGKSAQ